MTPKTCPKCLSKREKRSIFVHHGTYFRSSDKKTVSRFRCKSCEATFSNAALFPFYRSKVRHKRKLVRQHLCSSVSMRRTAKNLNLTRNTVAKMLVQEAAVSEEKLNRLNAQAKPCSVIQFDDMETFEHSKCKPLSITLVVEEGSRRILGIEVSQMAANGRLAEKSRAKYGVRKDRRSRARNNLFKKIRPLVREDAVIKSDENPYYPRDVKRHFPKATHKTYLGKRGASTGLGEIKKVKFDPIFSLNHTCAMFRDNVKRLARKTWCTTKRADRLYAHLVLYAHFHNSQVLTWN